MHRRERANRRIKKDRYQTGFMTAAHSAEKLKKGTFNRVQLGAAITFWAYIEHCHMIQIEIILCALGRFSQFFHVKTCLV